MTLADRILAADKEIVTPRYRTWIKNHVDEGYPPWVAERIAAEMAKQPRVRSGTFSSSSAGSCKRRQELEFIGAKVPTNNQPNPELSNIYNDGKWRHLRWQANLLTAGIIDDMEVPAPWKEQRAMGTMDGLGTVPDDHPRKKWRCRRFGLELKGMFSWQLIKLVRNGEQKEAHLNQIHRYFLSSGLDLFVYLIENKDANTWKEYVIEPDPKRLDAQRKELEALNRAVDAGKLHKPLFACTKRVGPDWNNCGFGGEYGTCERASSAWMRRWKEEHGEG
jgi:hypothetical protein